MADRPSTISTHVLDTGRGLPAAGVRVRLWRLIEGQARLLGEHLTDADGRVAALAQGPIEAGRYRLEFDIEGLSGPFFRSVQLELLVDDPDRSYHVPLLVGPYLVSSYRGT